MTREKYTITWTDSKKEEAITELTSYFSEHGSGESIYQSDKAQIEALEVLAGIADSILGYGEGLIFRYYEED